MVRQGEQHVVALEIYWPIPSEAATLPGTTLQMLARMWQEGTASRTASQIQTELARFGAFIETGASDEHLHLAIYTIERFLPDLLPLIGELVSAPGYPQDRLALLIAQSLQGLKVNREKTGYLAGQAFRTQMYSAKHIWGHPTEDKDLEQLAAADLITFYNDHVATSKPLVFLSGQYSDALAELVATSLPLTGLKYPLAIIRTGCRLYTWYHHQSAQGWQ